MDGKAPPDADDLVLELTGDAIEQGTVDAEAGLRAMLAYVRALITTSKILEQELTLTGIFVEDKCVQLRTRANNQKVAQTSIEYFQGVLEGEMGVPRGLTRDLNEVRSSFEGLAPNVSAFASIGDARVHVFSRSEVPRQAQAGWHVAGREVHRASVQRIGGAQPRVQLKTAYDGPITADIPSHSLARKLGAMLYMDVDATLEVVRDDDGEVVSAKVVDFRKLEALSDPLSQLQDWFRPAADRWSGIDYDAEIRDED